jgi:CCR4-NOT transcription complex subunit 4
LLHLKSKLILYHHTLLITNTFRRIAQFKAKVQKDAKKKAEQRQKEAQKREVESLNRKHLSGLRVIQKNLVYVVGLSPSTREDEILQTLRGEKYFGQYGKIIKIVVSKAKSTENGGSLGVYVTFARKEDAAKCIAAVNGSQNGDRILRAQLGTTKYCSAYLRNEICTNKQCMFLHEPGDNDDSYSRQDLSSINSVNTQRPLPAMASLSGTSSRQASQTQAPIQQAQPVAAAAQPMLREGSKDGSDSGDGSALPSSASWAKQRSRRGSHATSGATPSPAISQALPATTEPVEDHESMLEQQESESAAPAGEPTSSAAQPRPDRDPILMDLLRSINSPALSLPSFESGGEGLDQNSYPPLFDNQGGEKRRAIRDQQEETRLHVEQDSQGDIHSVGEAAEDEEPESGISGSLQLGGEPEDGGGREGNVPQGFHSQRRPSTQLPIQRSSNSGSFGPAGVGQNFTQGLSNLSSINGRTLTPQQQQQLMLLKSGQPQAGFLDQYPPGIGSSHSPASALFQHQGHNRQSSRFDFANGSSAASSVKPSANPKFLAQQSSMMPSGSHAQGNQFYGTSMQSPPPGLKSSSTPPMFGQGHTFGSSMAGASLFSTGKESSSDMLNMLRVRGATGSSQVHDSKREYMIPSFLQQYPSASSTPAPASGPQASLYGPQTGAFNDFGQKQKKKGKKHRHANTSSSGGGGLVDLADPSILQARMQHQQQSNAGVGQGLFGGQAEGGYNPSMMYGAGFGRW